MTGRRNLPGWAADLARDGLPPADLADRSRPGRGRRNVHRAVARVALSAVNAGWTFADFDALLVERGSHLGNQLRSGGKGRPDRPLREVHRALDRAWDSAVRKVADSPPRPPIELVKARVAECRTWLDTATLPPADAAMMGAWCDQAERYDSLTPVMPGRVVGELTDLPHRTAVDTLRRLDRAGLLVCVDRGKGGARGGDAAVYRLGNLHTSPDGRRPTHISRTEGVCGSAGDVCGPPEPPADLDCIDHDCPPPEDDEEA